MTPARRSAAGDVAVALVAGGLALAVYVRSLAPGLLWGDSAEFQFAAWLGGFAHPTGYPLYLMLGWLWSHVLSLGDPAYRMNLFSAFWGGVAVALFALAAMRLLRLSNRVQPPLEIGSLRGSSRAWSRAVALGAALLFASTPTFWSQAVIAEVYTLHAALLAALLLALAAWGERILAGDAAGAHRLSPVIVLLFGLGLAHHRATILLIPPALLFGWIVLGRGAGGALRSLRPGRAALLLACLLVPLLLYLYIPLRAPRVPYFKLELAPGAALPLYDTSLAGFVGHVTGSVFRTALAAPPDFPSQITGVARGLVAEVSPNGVILGLIGVAWLLMARRTGGRLPWAWLALTGTFLAAQVAFNLFYAIGDIHVFYIPVYLVWSLWMAAGAWALGRWLAAFLARLVSSRSAWPRAAGALAAAAVLVAVAFRSAAVNWPSVQRATDDSARRAWDALSTAALPPNAVLVTNDRDEMAPLWYLKYVEGRLPGVDGLFPLLQPGPDWADVVRVIERGLDSGRPVWLVKPMPGLEVMYDLAPPAGERAASLGPLVEVRRWAGTAPEVAVDALYGEVVRLKGYAVRPATIAGGGPLEVVLYWEPVSPLDANWTTFVQVLNARGDKVGQSDHRPGGEYYPSSLWRAGETVRDAHVLALSADPGDGPYRLVAGLYTPAGDSLCHLGEPRTIGELRAAP